MAQDISFYKGAATSPTEFAAVASFDALEQGDELSGTAVLLKFSTIFGWSKRLIVEERRMADVATLELSKGTTAPYALSEDGELFDFQSTAPVVSLENLNGVAMRSAFRQGADNYIIGDSGYYFRARDASGFQLMTDAHILPRPDWDADDDEMNAYFKSQTYIMNAAIGPYGRVAMTEISKVLFLESDLSLTEVLDPRIFVGVCHDPVTYEFWFCGHSPTPIVARENAPGQLRVVETAPRGSHTFTDLTLFGDDIYLADTDLKAGGLFVLTAPATAGSNVAAVELPVDFGTAPVWKVEAMDGILWVLRVKDLLRFDGQQWERFVPEG